MGSREVTTVEAALGAVRRLAIDTAPIIYLVERHPVYADRMRSIVERAEKGLCQLVTSALTLTEVLTLPLENQAVEIAEAYRTILLGTPYTRLVPIDSEAAEQAARLRAKYRLKTPDAIQLAIALQARCDAFLTNDGRLRRVDVLPVVLLSELAD